MSVGNTISDVIGWIYFAAWSISFYPQIFLNYRRKSVKGLSLDFLYLNITGFTCYTIYNASLYFNDHIRAEYAARHEGKAPLVQANDVFFGIHALAITLLTIGQTFYYRKRSGGLKFPWIALIFTIIAAIVTAIFCILEGTGHLQWLDVLYQISMVKVVISFVKYCPQLYMNYRRKSTAGWSIGNILLDFTGGTLSLTQMIMDAGLDNDWDGITGNPSKLALALLSIFFDCAFMSQHYIFYRGRVPLDEATPAVDVDVERGSLHKDALSVTSEVRDPWKPALKA